MRRSPGSHRCSPPRRVRSPPTRSAPRRSGGRVGRCGARAGPDTRVDDVAGASTHRVTVAGTGAVVRGAPRGADPGCRPPGRDLVPFECGWGGCGTCKVHGRGGDDRAALRAGARRRPPGRPARRGCRCASRRRRRRRRQEHRALERAGAGAPTRDHHARLLAREELGPDIARFRFALDHGRGLPARAVRDPRAGAGAAPVLLDGGPRRARPRSQLRRQALPGPARAASGCSRSRRGRRWTSSSLRRHVAAGRRPAGRSRGRRHRGLGDPRRWRSSSPRPDRPGHVRRSVHVFYGAATRAELVCWDELASSTSRDAGRRTCTARCVHPGAGWEGTAGFVTARSAERLPGPARRRLLRRRPAGDDRRGARPCCASTASSSTACTTTASAEARPGSGLRGAASRPSGPPGSRPSTAAGGAASPAAAAPAGPGAAGGDEGVQPALRLVVRAAARAVVGAGGQVGEVRHDPVRVDVRQPEGADARGVDHPAAAGQPQRDRGRRGVPPAAGDVVDHADGPVGARDQRVDQRRLADAGVPDEHA